MTNGEYCTKKETLFTRVEITSIINSELASCVRKIVIMHNVFPIYTVFTQKRKNSFQKSMTMYVCLFPKH